MLPLIGVVFGVLSCVGLSRTVYGELVPRAWRSTRRLPAAEVVKPDPDSV